jgi:hypothetical protein
MKCSESKVKTKHWLLTNYINLLGPCHQCM